MTDRAGPPPPPSPLILLAIRDEWLLRSLDSLLVPGGFRVVSAGDPESALTQVRRRQPDGVLLDAELAHGPRFDFCRTLRADPAFSPAAPIILIRRGYPIRAEQLEALRAGAWELRGDPIDAEELLLRLGVYVQAKLEVERVGADGLLDRASGLYNSAGMTRRSQELATLSVRQGLPLSCVVFREPQLNGDGDRVAAAFKAEGRISDAIGRTGPDEFTVFAPATDRTGAARLVERLGGTVAARAKLARPLKSGFSSSNGTPQVDPRELLERARSAVDAS